jgi:tRNA uridine 5-carboxymethylaminomethyl modification enzyme
MRDIVMPRDFDIIVIGGGHAGAEAAHAAARLGASTALLTMDPAKIGALSCNPAMGGLAKGQMIREIDALGGLMGVATDNTGIQFRMLNRSKGPAVWGPRAQADKYKYAREVQRLLGQTPNLTIIRGEVAEIRVDQQKPAGSQNAAISTVCGVILADGQRLTCRAVIMTTGTFLRGLMHTGEAQTVGGRVSEPAAGSLSDCLMRLGLELGRLKTGTPPRLKKQSIDFGPFECQPGDEQPMAFSYLNEYENREETAPCESSLRAPCSSAPWRPPLPQVDCHIGETNPAIHELIRANLHRAPMYSGQIHSVGPRYCPSIEDKIVRFADKTAHHIFLEPEGLDTDEIYCNGISTSLPADVQDQILRLVPGLERAEVLRYGYAVEYDMVWPTQIRSTLETKKVAGLFLAGQINGTSGYEEAGAQGLLAGINAAQYAAGREADFTLGRDQAYLGVLVDDLVTKPPTEPYRMFTSRAEHRLHLRADNADSRLTPIGRNLGLVDEVRWSGFQQRREQTRMALALLAAARIDGAPATDYLRRAEKTWADVVQKVPALAVLPAGTARAVEIELKYAGYIARQDRQIERFAQLEQKLIPPTTDYSSVAGLRNEAKNKFAQFTPRSLGQALRISGITPADITVLAIHLSRRGEQVQG